jgi:hypothetical protein
MGSADLPEFAAHGDEFLVFVQRHAATFLPKKVTDKILLPHAISRRNSSSATLINARRVCINTKA